MQLILFDIDGTLLRVRPGTSRRVVAHVLHATLGVDPPPGDFDFHGKTDRQILRELATILERPADAARLDQMAACLVEYWAAALSAEDVDVLEGVVDLLDTLSQRADVALGLLTGNLEPAARIKLATHDLNRFFPFGAYGSDNEDRRQLPDVALTRARSHHRMAFSPDTTVIIGDSHRDIECARAGGMRVVAVASGPLSMDELARHNPDLLVRSLADAGPLLNFLALDQ